ncbi:MAG: cupin domain-containing protein [Planctomycetota bacterium]|nr:MAG: cupin domain-containing protein [Planctomycetota bacterium]
MEDILARHNASGGPYLRLIDEPTLSAGLYIVPAGGTDDQTPHRLDEAYYIIAGRATFVVDGHERSARAGDVIFVKRGVEHRFIDIQEELRVLVFFSKADAS